jgi:hypothetical protein
VEIKRPRRERLPWSIESSILPILSSDKRQAPQPPQALCSKNSPRPGWEMSRTQRFLRSSIKHHHNYRCMDANSKPKKSTIPVCLRNVKIGIITWPRDRVWVPIQNKNPMRKMRKSNFKKKCVGNQIGPNTWDTTRAKAQDHNDNHHSGCCQSRYNRYRYHGHTTLK